MARTLVTSGSPWEAKLGYSRAVVVNDTIYTSASAATNPDGSVVSPELYEQTKHAIGMLGGILEQNGFSLADVVQSKLYVSDFANWAEATRAHGEVFSEIRPAFTLVNALPFIDPAILVEVEFVAVRSGVGKHSAEA
jgi:enamine deaminase RidA (YjgF/YER057c/UK114 family)